MRALDFTTRFHRSSPKFTRYSYPDSHSYRILYSERLRTGNGRTNRCCRPGLGSRETGKTIRYFTDPHTVNILSSIVPTESIQSFPVIDPEPSETLARRILRDLNPGAAIAIERPGPDDSGRFHTMRQIDITPWTAHLEYLFKTPVTIGIGDGGNELGLGAIRPLLPPDRPATNTCATHTLIGDTSNDAAYALIAALEMVSDRDDLLPDASTISGWLTRLVSAGAVDGILGVPALSVDTFTPNDTSRILSRLKEFARALRPIFREISRFQSDNQNRYGVSIDELFPSLDPRTGTLSLSGHVLLEHQRTTLLDQLTPLFGSIQSSIRILADPANTTQIECLARSNRNSIPLLDRPNGKLTSEIVPGDYPLRVLHHMSDWIAVQLPDLTIGWIEPGQINLFEGLREGLSGGWSLPRASSDLISELNVAREVFIADASDWIGTAIQTGRPHALGHRLFGSRSGSVLKTRPSPAAPYSRSGQNRHSSADSGHATLRSGICGQHHPLGPPCRSVHGGWDHSRLPRRTRGRAGQPCAIQGTV